MRRLGHRGFTLIELLSVMAIMMIIAGIAVTSYFGMVRGAGMRSAVSHLHSTLLLARQAAVMNGKKTSVIFAQGDTNAGYVVVQKAGELTYVKTIPGGQRIHDDYSDWSYLGGDDIVGATIYDLTDGETSVVLTNVTMGTTQYLETSESIWIGDESYGWEMHPRNTLPSKYQFGYGVSPAAPDTVVFNGDGTTPTAYTIDIYESLHADSSGDPHTRISVAALTGFVSVSYE